MVAARTGEGSELASRGSSEACSSLGAWGFSLSLQVCWVSKCWLGLLRTPSSPFSWWFSWVSSYREQLEHPQTTHMPSAWALSPALHPGTPKHVGPLGGAKATPSGKGCVNKWGVFLEGLLFLLALAMWSGCRRGRTASPSISSDRVPHQWPPPRGWRPLRVD